MVCGERKMLETVTHQDTVKKYLLHSTSFHFVKPPLEKMFPPLEM